MTATTAATAIQMAIPGTGVQSSPFSSPKKVVSKATTENVFRSDEDVRNFKDIEEFHKALESLENTDVWLEPYGREVYVTSIPQGIANFLISNPMVFCTYMETMKAHRNGEDVDVPGFKGGITRPVEECMLSIGLFVGMPNAKGVEETFPMRPNAYRSLLERVKLNCGAMTQMVETSARKAFPLNDIASMITYSAEHAKDRWKVLWREGKISFFGSPQYAIIPCWEVIDVAERFLEKEFGEAEFLRSSMSVDYLVAQYSLDIPEITEPIKATFNKAGMGIDELTAVCQVCTSDTSNSAIQFRVLLIGDGKPVAVGSNVSLIHSGKANAAALSDLLANRFASSFKDAEETIERLGNIDINDVGNVISLINGELGIFSKRGGIQSVIDSSHNPGTAVDVYIQMLNLVSTMFTNHEIGPGEYMELLEQVDKTRVLPFDLIDRGEWHRKSKN